MTLADKSTQVDTPSCSTTTVKNTAVYVTGLPSDTTIDELFDHFSRAGVIMDDLISGGPRIKIYYKQGGDQDDKSDSHVVLKEESKGKEALTTEDEAPLREEGEGEEQSGDALVVYLRDESVQLACTILDESQLRPGVFIHVQVAQPQATKEAPGDTTGVKKEGKIDKETWKRQMMLMKKKLAWFDEEEVGRLAAVTANKEKTSRVVILRNVYDKRRLIEDPALLLELKQDLVEECSKRIGAVTVQILDDYDDGRCSLKFKEQTQADACIKLMNGRKYEGRKLIAESYDGSFPLSLGNKNRDNADAEARLERFGQWLEEQEASTDDSDFEQEPDKDETISPKRARKE